MRVPRRNARFAVFGIPTMIGVLSLVGLVVGLLGDGVHDVLAWIGLGAAVVAMAWSLSKARRGRWDRAS